jgi:hypothetical protein
MINDVPQISITLWIVVYIEKSKFHHRRRRRRAAVTHQQNKPQRLDLSPLSPRFRSIP